MNEPDPITAGFFFALSVAGLGFAVLVFAVGFNEAALGAAAVGLVSGILAVLTGANDG